MKVNLDNLGYSYLSHLIKNTYKHILKQDEYSKYSNGERLKKKVQVLPQAKRETSTKGKGNKKTNKRRQNETPSRYIFLIIVAIPIILGAFQLGIIGRMTSSFLSYLLGMGRYLTYILVLIAAIFITYSKQVPRTRRSISVIVLQLALSFIV